MNICPTLRKAIRAICPFVIATEIALINADVLVSLLSYLCNVLDNFFRKGLFMDVTLDNTATSESVHLIHLDRLE